MKKFFSLLLPIITIVLIVGGTYFYMHSGSEKIKNEHSKYVSLINDDHDFGAGLKGLESLTTEKAKSVLSNVENEIETATELKSIDESLKNADIESAENHLDKAKQLDTSKTFGKATNWFNTEISNYKKAVEEINELDIYAEDYDTLLKNIVEKYHFNYDSIKKKLLGNKDNLEKKITSSLIIGAGKIAHYLIEFFIKDFRNIFRPFFICCLFYKFFFLRCIITIAQFFLNILKSLISNFLTYIVFIIRAKDIFTITTIFLVKLHYSMTCCTAACEEVQYYAILLCMIINQHFD